MAASTVRVAEAVYADASIEVVARLLDGAERTWLRTVARLAAASTAPRARPDIVDVIELGPSSRSGDDAVMWPLAWQREPPAVFEQLHGTLVVEPLGTGARLVVHGTCEVDDVPVATGASRPHERLVRALLGLVRNVVEQGQV